ncbi:MAG TPA: sulfatase [Longimicrobiaceae bacterium]
MSRSKTRRLWPIALAHLLAAIPPTLAAQEPGSAGQIPRPNIIVILTDDQGYGDLSSYGHPTLRTPNIDRMAEEGIRFTSFYATTSVCTPSRAALLTGRYPVRTGLVRVLGPGAEMGLPDSELTLAEALREQGYRTAMIGKWHLGDRPEFNPLRHGFDEFFGVPYSHDFRPPFVADAPPEGVPLLRGYDIVERPVDFPNMTQRFTAEAIRFIRESGGRPFFLYFAHPMPHLPVEPSEDFRGRSRAGRYGDVVEEIDWSVGEILRTLKELGIEQRTIVVYTSDNGPWQNQPPRMLQDGQRPWDVGSAGPLRGAKGSTWEGGVRVPGIVWWPGTIPAGQVSADIVTNMDLFPTLLRLAGGELPEGHRLDGVDILPVLEGQGPSPRQELFYFLGPELQAVRVGRWKLRVVPPASQAGQVSAAPQQTSAVPELYDLEVDPSERYNMAAEHPDIVSRLMRRMEEFGKEVGS